MVITNRGQPAALLSPVPTSTRDQLVAAGRLVPAARDFGAAARPERLQVSITADALLELDRVDER